MPSSENQPIDYLTIGHLTKDLAGSGYSLGGTSAYASLTALAFSLKPAIVTSCALDLNLQSMGEIEIFRKSSRSTTTFENIETVKGREQILHEIAEPITSADLPLSFLSTPIIHLGPVSSEVDPGVISNFSPLSFIGITPQGWMRNRGEGGKVVHTDWIPDHDLAERADAVVISIEDVRGDEEIIQKYAGLFRLLAVTEGYNGVRVYWHGDVRHFRAPKVKIVDPTGAGDIFAAVFFIRLQASRDPWEAATTAVNLASLSVTRPGLQGVPKPEEVQSNLMEIIRGSAS